MADDKERLLSNDVGDSDNELSSNTHTECEHWPSQSSYINVKSETHSAPLSTTLDEPSCDGSIDTKQTKNLNEDCQAEEEREQESKPRVRLTIRQKLTFAGIAISNVSSLMSLSILAPFFPNEAAKKDVGTTVTGFVFGFFALVNFIASPFLGKYLPVIGAKFMFLSGSFMSAGCNILFGFLDKIYDKTTFLIFCFTIRFFEALGSAATVTAGLAICATTFPDNVAQVDGMLEMFSGLGFAVGPPVGSFLYGIGGYTLPFVVIGGTAIALAVLNSFILPSVGSSGGDERPGSLLSVARIPAVWFVLLGCLCGSASLGFVDPTLSVHLTNGPLKVSPSHVGVMFLLIGGFYAASAPIWGYLADKLKRTRIMMVMGLYFVGVSFLLIGPSPPLNLPSKLWIMIISLILLGLSTGLAGNPPFLDLLLTAEWYGLPADMSTQAVISGLFGGVFSLGTFLGPSLAGVLVDNFGFSWSATIFAASNFFVLILISLFSVWEYRCGKGRRRPNQHVNDSSPEIQRSNSLIVNT